MRKILLFEAPEKMTQAVDIVRLGDKLARKDEDVLVLPHLTRILPHELKKLNLENVDTLLAGAFLYPRATEWLLRFNFENLEKIILISLDLRDFSSHEEAFEAFCKNLPEVKQSVKGKLITPEIQTRERWYPVIDKSRCVDCGKCMEFCLFGVYGNSDGEILVQEPDQCKPGCPACARLCPAKAIIFPNHPDEPEIAGANINTGVKQSLSNDKQPDELDDLIEKLEKREAERNNS